LAADDRKRKERDLARIASGLRVSRLEGGEHVGELRRKEREDAV